MRKAFAGENLGLTPDLVAYIGRQSQLGRTSPEILTAEDSRIASAVTDAVVDHVYDGARDGDYSNMPVIPGLEEEGYQHDQLLDEYRNRAFPGEWEEQEEPELLARGMSFDLSYPKIPGKNLEGVPNANDPLMREKLRQRLLKNPHGGQELPGFLRGV